MFNFFKKNKKPTEVQEEKVLSEDDIAIIKTQLSEKHAMLSLQLENTEKDESLIAKLYEDIGLLSRDIDKDKAIEYLEQSLSYKATIGDGYKCLMSLYNQKRAESARNGDGDGIEKWMNKMDEMRQIAKKVVISG